MILSLEIDHLEIYQEALDSEENTDEIQNIIYDEDVREMHDQMYQQFSEIMLIIHENSALADVKPEVLPKKQNYPDFTGTRY